MYSKPFKTGQTKYGQNTSPKQKPGSHFEWASPRPSNTHWQRQAYRKYNANSLTKNFSRQHSRHSDSRRHSPKFLPLAPPEVLGLGIPALWNQQGIEHVAALLRHGDSPANNVTGCLLRDVMATLRLELGLPGVPFEHSLLPTFSTLYHADLLTHSMGILQ
jgi:hypothetical protein